jgi:hypothetical protein
MDKKKKQNPIEKTDIFPLEFEEEQEADHVIDGYHVNQPDNHDTFNDDLSTDENDYELEQEKWNAVQSEDLQPIAVDRYFERFGKSRRTSR